MVNFFSSQILHFFALSAPQAGHLPPPSFQLSMGAAGEVPSSQQQEHQQSPHAEAPLPPSPPTSSHTQGSTQASPSKPSSSNTKNSSSSWECLGCRLTGLAFGVGGGGYILSSLLQDPPPRGANKAAVLGSAGSLFCLGLYRAFF